jgi:aminoglycoside phosphotransferase family enzyme
MPLDTDNPGAPLTAKVAFLSRPENYPEQPSAISAIETHMSWVFLGDHWVYKLKKPVRYDFLDFSSVTRRRMNCQDEVRLNARLAPGIYLDVVALVEDTTGALSLGGHGRVVDWLVKMRRLPQDCLLEYQMRHGTLNGDALRRTAQVLADFYRRAAPVAMTAADYVNRLRSRLLRNIAAISQAPGALPAATIDRILTRLDAYVQQHRELLGARAAQRRIIEAHGDLRPEHICLADNPVIIDCLEFNRDFRLLDPLDELAFLAMECGRLGYPRVGEVFTSTYMETTGDSPAPGLENFYKANWSAFRCGISVWHTVDPLVKDQGKWIHLAARYLEMASAYCALLP